MDTIFSQIADLIRAKGWIQGAFETDEGMCLEGANIRALNTELASIRLPSPFSLTTEWSQGLRDQWDGCIARHKEVLRKLATHIGEQVAPWNDTPGRTKEEVLAVLAELHEKELAEKGLL